MLVLPGGMELLPGRRQHLLRGYAHGHQSGARHPRRRSLCGGEPLRYRAGAHRARRSDGHPERAGRACGRGRGFLHRPRYGHHADDGSGPRRTADGDSNSGNVGRRAVLLREGARSKCVGLPAAERGGGDNLRERPDRTHPNGGECCRGSTAAPACGRSGRRGPASQRGDGGARRADRHRGSGSASLQRLQDPVDAEFGEAGHQGYRPTPNLAIAHRAGERAVAPAGSETWIS